MAISGFPTVPGFYQRVKTFTSSGTFVHPDGYGSARPVYVVCIGAAGGGGSGAIFPSTGVTNTIQTGGMGGASGYTAATILSVSSDTSITIGTGGTGGAAVTGAGAATNGNNGNNGGNSAFGNLVSEGGQGGSGGRTATGSNSIIVSGFRGGTAAEVLLQTGPSATAGAGGNLNGLTNGNSSFNITGTTLTRINPGQNGGLIKNGGATAVQESTAQFAFSPLSFVIPGSGASGGIGRNATAAYTQVGGTGGPGFYGSGGDGGTSSHTLLTAASNGTAGSNATNGGGGGGGGFASATGAATCTSGAGGNGGNGLVVVFY
jgi:hypothetical protein